MTLQLKKPASSLDIYRKPQDQEGIILPGDSLQFAKQFKKNHNDVLKKIRKELDKQVYIGESQLALAKYVDVQNKKRDKYDFKTYEAPIGLLFSYESKKEVESAMRLFRGLLQMGERFKMIQSDFQAYLKQHKNGVLIGIAYNSIQKHFLDHKEKIGLKHLPLPLAKRLGNVASTYSREYELEVNPQHCTYTAKKERITGQVNHYLKPALEYAFEKERLVFLCEEIRKHLLKPKSWPSKKDYKPIWIRQLDANLKSLLE